MYDFYNFHKIHVNPYVVVVVRVGEVVRVVVVVVVVVVGVGGGGGVCHLPFDIFEIPSSQLMSLQDYTTLPEQLFRVYTDLQKHLTSSLWTIGAKTH